MADAVSVALAKAVVTRLNAGSYETAFTAERRRLIDWKRQQLQTVQVSVMGGDVDSEPRNRSADQDDHTIHIGIQKLVDPNDLTEADALERLAEQIRDRMRGEPLTAGSVSARWLRASYRVPWDQASLRQNEFLAVVEVIYRVIR